MSPTAWSYRIIVFGPISDIDKTTTPNASIELDRVGLWSFFIFWLNSLWSFLLYQQPQAVINEPQKLVPSHTCSDYFIR